MGLFMISELPSAIPEKGSIVVNVGKEVDKHGLTGWRGYSIMSAAKKSIIRAVFNSKYHRTGL